MDKSVIIIGAGIGGLATGCYGQMNGYRTRIFEMNTGPGGLCTAWQRQGYTIDGCLQWLVGSTSGKLHRIWEELGATQGQQIIHMERFFRVEGTDGRVFDAYCDIDRLEEQMIELAPEATYFIHAITKTVRRLTHFNMPVGKAPELYGRFGNMGLVLRMIPYMGDYQKWNQTTMAELSQEFSDPILRIAWETFWPPEYSSVFALFLLAWLHNKNAGYIIGGSKAIPRTVEKRYINLGGEVVYRSPVARILVENDRAVGIRLADGTEHRADYVISAADSHATIFDLLQGKYTDDGIRGNYEKLPIFQPLILLGLGVNRQFTDVPPLVSGLVLPLENPVAIGDKKRRWLNVRIHNFDPTLAPEGKTLLTVALDSDYSFWQGLRPNTPRYRTEKEKVAETVISLLDKRFPGLAGQVEMRDVATPVTFNRYTGNWQGSYEGWLPTPSSSSARIGKTLPGLDNFYMAGQWVQTGGSLSSSAVSGRHVIQILCKREGRRFTATTVR